MTGIAGRHDAVKEVHAAGNGFDDVGRRTHAHQISGAIGRHVRFYRFDNLIHYLRRLTDRQAADGITGQIQLRNFLHMLNTQIFVGTALINAPQHLTGVNGIRTLFQTLQFILAALEPPGRAVTGFCNILMGCGILDAFVKGHGNIGAQRPLNQHTLLGAHKDMPSVGMGIEINALLLDFSQNRQREHLESTTIGKDRAVPIHELMQAAQRLDHVLSGTNVEMIGIGKLHLTSQIAQIFSRNAAFDGSLCSHIHENGGLNGSMSRLKFAATCFAVGRNQFKHLILLR